jgi:hypothetical protein
MAKEDFAPSETFLNPSVDDIQIALPPFSFSLLFSYLHFEK